MNKIKMLLGKINLKTVERVCYWFILATLITVAGLTFASTLNIPGNYRLYVVQSGSMEPKIHTGSIVLVKPRKEYAKGDIVTFRDGASSKKTITHRIYEVKNSADVTSFITRGDANNAPDSGEISLNQIVGKMLFTIPLLGFPISFAKTLQGLIILVIIPAVVIIYGEVMNIKAEALRLIEARKTRKLSRREEIEEKVGEEIIALENEAKKVEKKLVNKIDGKRNEK